MLPILPEGTLVAYRHSVKMHYKTIKDHKFKIQLKLTRMKREAAKYAEGGGEVLSTPLPTSKVVNKKI